MNKIYLYFFLKQLLQVIVFLSELNPLLKIALIFGIDYTKSRNKEVIKEGFKNAGLLNTSNGKKDRVFILDTIGSLFGYFQVIILLIENKLVTKNQLIFLLILLLTHTISVTNYLYYTNGDSKLHEKKDIFPDIFKPMVFIMLIVNYSLKEKSRVPEILVS